MTTYIIAGSSTNKLLTQCEMMGEQLMSESRLVTVFKVARHPSEWPEFLNAICENFGFYKVSDPIIFTAEGVLIGDIDDFQKLLERTYKIGYQINIENSIKRTEQMSKEIELKHKIKIEGPGLKERIDDFINRAIKNSVQKFSSQIFKSEKQNSIIFLKRKSTSFNFLFVETPKKPKEVIQSKYKDFDDFKFKYEKTLVSIQEELREIAEKRRLEALQEEMKLKKEEEERLQKLQEAAEKQAEEKLLMEKRNEIEKRIEGEEKEKGKSELDSEKSKALPSEGSLNVGPTQEQSDQSKISQDKKKEAPVQVEYILQEEFPLSFGNPFINDWCSEQHYVLNGDSKILLLHPMPVYAGEMLFVDAKMNELNRYEIKDYAATYGRTNKVLKTEFGEGLNSYSINIISPIKRNEWKDLLKLMDQLHMIAYWNFLPINEKAPKLNSQLIHLLILPCLSFDKITDALPIEASIRSSVEKFKSKDKGEVFELKEFAFPHKIYAQSQSLTADTAEKGYWKLIEELKIDPSKYVDGLYTIVGLTWIYVIPIKRPYYSYKNKNYYFHPLAYAGIIDYSVINDYWPQTAGIDLMDETPLSLLKLQV